MSGKSRLYLYIIAGGYLVYTGFGLVKSVMAERPENFGLYAAIGVIFVLIGGIFAIKNILKLIKGEDID